MLKYFAIIIPFFLFSCITSVNEHIRKVQYSTTKQHLSFKINVNKYMIDGVSGYYYTTCSNGFCHNNYIDYKSYAKTTQDDIKEILLKRDLLSSENTTNPDIIINIDIRRSNISKYKLYNKIAGITLFILPAFEKEHFTTDVSFVDGCSNKILKTYNTSEDAKYIIQILLAPAMPFTTITPRTIENNIIMYIINKAITDNILNTSCKSNITN